VREEKRHTAVNGSGVVKTLQAGGRRVDDVAAGEDIGTVCPGLAVAITTTTSVSTGRHCKVLPRLRWCISGVGMKPKRSDVEGEVELCGASCEDVGSR
jgi:hypothetical protein